MASTSIGTSRVAVQQGTGGMILSIIGMSGSGKTYWSRKLAEFGFHRVSCDDRIEEQLQLQFQLHRDGYSGIQGVARWTGHPYEAGYQERQAAYLAAETKVVKEILETLERGVTRDLVIDTTGSVVYTGEELCRGLLARSIVVHLESSLTDFEVMFQQYSKDPKPVVWGDLFRRQENETNEAALARCYKDLLQYRRTLYEKYATVTIPTSLLWQQQPDAKGFLDLVQRQLLSRR